MLSLKSLTRRRLLPAAERIRMRSGSCINSPARGRVGEEEQDSDVDAGEAERDRVATLRPPTLPASGVGTRVARVSLGWRKQASKRPDPARSGGVCAKEMDAITYVRGRKGKSINTKHDGRSSKR
uniref:Uncharacterized protein n=1 Tax=Anopheles atroparvus TaxID=41427 RepID=A0A182IVJ2_ANOAO